MVRSGNADGTASLPAGSPRRPVNHTRAHSGTLGRDWPIVVHHLRAKYEFQRPFLKSVEIGRRLTGRTAVWIGFVGSEFPDPVFLQIRDAQGINWFSVHGRVGNPFRVQVSALGDAQLRPDRTTIRAFTTSSSSDHCLVTLSESNFRARGATIFCAPRTFQGQQGILVSVFFPQPMPSGFFLSASIYQEGAHGFGTPVFYPGT